MMSKKLKTDTAVQKSHLITSPIITFNDVLEATSLSRSTLVRMLQAGEFPQPVALSKKRCGFYANEVNQWLSNRPRLTSFHQFINDEPEA